CGPPATRCAPRPTMMPASSTTSAPTIGFGLVCPRPRSASASAFRMKWASSIQISRADALPLLFEQRVDVFLRGERDQVVDAFADADVADRQLQIVRDGNRDAP